MADRTYSHHFLYLRFGVLGSESAQIPGKVPQRGAATTPLARLGAGPEMMFKGVCAVALLFCVLNVSAEDPDIKRDMVELVMSRGYPLEQYDVTTEDGKLRRVQHHRICSQIGL